MCVLCFVAQSLSPLKWITVTSKMMVLVASKIAGGNEGNICCGTIKIMVVVEIESDNLMCANKLLVEEESKDNVSGGGGAKTDI